tara:strand:+ start:99 stop:398 length:300 start_codon:yes stop_codon:yes gene_type:complete
MRKITQEAINNFNNSTPFKKGNTVIEVLPNVTIMNLHGNSIAFKYNDPEGTISITNCGWFSTTTKDRLNGIEGVSISQKKGVWFLNGVEWDGTLVDIKQ